MINDKSYKMLTERDKFINNSVFNITSIYYILTSVVECININAHLLLNYFLAQVHFPSPVILEFSILFFHSFLLRCAVCMLHVCASPCP